MDYDDGKNLITDECIYLFNEGTNYYSYLFMGAHLDVNEGQSGVRFRVWAPNAQKVSVVGNFNNWDPEINIMKKLKNSGVWELFIRNVGEFELYKYAVETLKGEVVLKSDPYAFFTEVRPATASIVYDLSGYSWGDERWEKGKTDLSLDKPISIYEVHLGSWRRNQDGSFLTYRDLAEELVDYAYDMGYTHIEILPITEHPLDDSWGYQVLAYYSVTSRFGTPKDFMYFVDKCHQKGLGVILDWVPGHFIKDTSGLAAFDGTALYEHLDPKQGEQPQWGTYIFNYGKNEVQSFLISNAMFFLDIFHLDGLRVDAVTGMLYLDFARKDYIPNCYGGRENLEAISFIKKLNNAISSKFPGALMIAEESGQWPMVTKSVAIGGLGFNYKWNMGWMNDILRYITKDPVHRKWHHNDITFSLMYAFTENYILPLSHDEVVHGKKSLLDKMPGDYWQKFAGLRALFGYMFAHPGKKLIFMGGEFGQFIEWRFYEGLDWHLLNYEMHKKLHEYVSALNHIYISHSCFWEADRNWSGFQWIDPNDYNQSVLSFIRKGKDPNNFIIVVVNFTPVPRENYRIGIPDAVGYKELFNSDDKKFGGSGMSNKSIIYSEQIERHGFERSVSVSVPPLAVIYLQPEHQEDDNINIKARRF